jgi:hypothetical protein
VLNNRINEIVQELDIGNNAPQSDRKRDQTGVHCFCEAP